MATVALPGNPTLAPSSFVGSQISFLSPDCEPDATAPPCSSDLLFSPVLPI